MDKMQEQLWKGDFGAQYTERNTYAPEELDQLYNNIFGITRTELNKEFLESLDIGNILEVGCNVGNQLRLLQKMGYENLKGIELQRYAVERAKQLVSDIDIIQGSAFDIPFKDGFFNLVFTSGVLIHIAPEDLPIAMKEISRVSNKYILGFEYYSDKFQEVDYRGNSNALWKGNFAELFTQYVPGLKLVKTKVVKYISDDNYDMIYLLEKM